MPSPHVPTEEEVDRILRRMLGEIVTAIKMRQVASRMYKTGVTTWTRKWYRVMALEDATILRLVRITDDTKGVVGLPLLLRFIRPSIVAAAKETEADLKTIHKFSRRLREIRNKTFIHADIQVIGNSQAFWKARNLTWPEVDRVLSMLHRVLEHVQKDRTGKSEPIPKFERPIKPD